MKVKKDAFQNLSVTKENNIQINKSIITENGTVVFQGELTPEEHDFVLQTGLTYLYEQGSLPFVSVDEEEIFNYGGCTSHDEQ